MTHLLRPVLVVALFLAGCTPNVSPESYSVGGVGQVNRAVRGTVISVRTVTIAGTQSGIGAAGGAAGGALAGSTVGGGARANAAGAIGGAIVLGVVGAMIEESSTRQVGFEYVVEAENGALLTIAQGGDVPLEVGKKVLVLYGAQSRVIRDEAD